MPNRSREDCKACVGTGWAGLIDEIYDVLPETAEIYDIKEKWGGLRFSVGDCEADVYDFVASIEEKSYTICEVCGKPGTLREELSWIRTLCDEHYKEENTLHKH